MTSSQATCLLCLSSNKNTINFYSDRGKELNIIGVLTTHFWFQLEEIKVLSQNICFECWNKTESFNEFYQSIRTVHKEFESVFVKVENDEDIEDDGEIYQPVQVPEDNFITNIFKIENQEAEDDESSDTSVYEIPHTNSIETRAFDVLPKTTQEKYLRAYDKFLVWKNGENIDVDCFSEAVMLEYFHYLKSKYKPTSLWVQYSILKTTIQRINNIDISYPEVTSLLKTSSIGYQPQRSNVFQPDEIRRFFTEAQDTEFLAVKVIMIFLIYGATSSDALTKVEVNDISEQGSVFVIKIPDTKTNEIRSFTVKNEYAEYVRKYKKLRPANVSHDRFFVNYQKGKCTVQPIGRNKFLNAPKAIAKFLKLEDAENYTCHSFRKESITNKQKMADLCSEQNNLERSTELTASSVDTGTVPKTTNKIGEDGKLIAFDLLPKNSQEKYLSAYEKFIAWKASEKIDKDCFSEATLLEYFHHMKPKYKPTSLWVQYSMLSTTIQKMNNIDICYPEVRTFLKTSSFGYLPQKCSVFEPDEMRRFLCEADDNEFLAWKVIMIFGTCGIARADTLTKVQVNDISEHGSVIVIKNPETKSNAVRSHTLENEYAACVQKYKALRPENVPHNRFFIHYQNGQCTAHPIGRNKFLNAPKIIANFLNLKDPESYTGHSFRKKSLKRIRNRGMRSSTGLESYIEECLPNKRKMSELNSEQMGIDTSTEANTSAMDTADAAITANKNCEDVKAWELLPEKSREKYVRSYENFLVWKTNEDIDKECFSEEVMLEYFNHLKTKYKPTSLCVEYSMLRTTIKKNDNVDINYPEITSLLKQSSIGFQPQKCNLFEPDELRRFLAEADDIKFLAVKVILIFGIYGAASADELTKVEVKDVSEHEEGSAFTIKIPDSKTNGIRSFTVDNEYAAHLKKYKKLRPKNIRHRRFFVNYQNGKCTVQPIGKNKFLMAPKTVANFLNLEDADNYTGHSFRRTSKKLMADGGVDVLASDGYAGCSSSAVVDSYIQEATADDRKIDLISEKNDFKRLTIPNTSTITSAMDTTAAIPKTFQNTFQGYQPQVHPHHLFPYGNTESALSIPTQFQAFLPHQGQPYLPSCGTSTVDVKGNDTAVQPDNNRDEKMVRGIQFGNFHNL